MGNKGKGLYNKFEVRRTDDKSDEGEKHGGCSYFVLDLDCDPFAEDALFAYAKACYDTHPLLSADITEILIANDFGKAMRELIQAQRD